MRNTILKQAIYAYIKTCENDTSFEYRVLKSDEVYCAVSHKYLYK